VREGDKSAWKEENPLRLAFRAREGDGVVGRRRAPSVSHFERGREIGVVGRKRPLHLAFKQARGHLKGTGRTSVSII